MYCKPKKVSVKVAGEAPEDDSIPEGDLLVVCQQKAPPPSLFHSPYACKDVFLCSDGG